jgi:hypothetical protein
MPHATTSSLTPHDSTYIAAEPAFESAPVPEFLESALESVEQYAREKPWHFGLWAMGVGFVIGWKMKVRLW